ncbi:MAG: hypothetical protein E7141_07505 [Rikenellaceae bacterium]|nr:hypothetical protein [Rikenellaceae bacterium]
MKKFLLFFMVLTVALSGCQKIEESIDALDNRLNALEQTLPTLESQIEMVNLAIIQLEEVDAALENEIETLKSSDKATENEIAALEQADKKLDSKISDLRNYVNSEINKAKNEAAATYATLDQLNSAKEELNDLKSAVSKLEVSLTTKIDNVIAVLDAKIADLEARLKAVEDKVDDLLARIQSVSYIPEYDDGKVLVERMSSKSWGELSFRISPKDAVVELEKVWSKALSCEAYYPKTRAVSLVKLAVTEFEGDAESGVVTVKISGEGLSDEFFAGEQTAKVALVISDGNNQVVSEYADMYGHETLDEIWYTTNDGATVKLMTSATASVKETFGADIISHTYENGKGVIKFDAPVTKVGDYAFNNSFNNVDNLTSVTLPNSVTAIGDKAFRSNNSLVHIDMGLNVESIGDHSFRTCGLETLQFSPKLKSIGAGILEFSSLTDVTIPESVESIADGAFRYMYHPTFHGKFASEDGNSLIVNNRLIAIVNSADMTEYVVPSNVTSIGESVLCMPATAYNKINLFSGNCASEDGSMLICDGVLCAIAGGTVTDLVVPESVTKISAYIAYMNKCLTSVVIPDSVTTIGYTTFSFCDKLKSVTIGRGIVDLGESNFRDCPLLAEINCMATTPPVLGGKYSFEKMNDEPYTIYVPMESVDAYKTAEYWSLHADHIVGKEF